MFRCIVHVKKKGFLNEIYNIKYLLTHFVLSRTRVQSCDSIPYDLWVHRASSRDPWVFVLLISSSEVYGDVTLSFSCHGSSR